MAAPCFAVPEARRWLRVVGVGSDPEWTIVCFPYAGSGGSVFGAWSRDVPGGLSVLAVQLPGREDRLAEPAIVDGLDLDRRLIPLLAPLLNGRVAFFGHSLGALIAFRLAHRLEQVHRLPIQHLFVSARRAPRIESPASRLLGLEQRALVKRLGELGGLPRAALDSPELMDVVLPALRGDLMLSRQLERDGLAAPEPFAISAAITGFAGLVDVSVPGAYVRAWAAHTRAGFRLHHIEGDHFFLRHRGRLLLELMRHELTAKHGQRAAERGMLEQ